MHFQELQNVTVILRKRRGEISYLLDLIIEVHMCFLLQIIFSIWFCSSAKYRTYQKRKMRPERKKTEDRNLLQRERTIKTTVSLFL